MLFLATTEESGIMMSLLRTILMNLCNFVYKLIIYIYELFLAIGNATILNSEQIQVVYTRVGLILGIVMIFRLIFSFVQYMIDPDKITDKETGVGSIVKKFIVVILALALTDWVFTKAFELQETILEENVIAKVVLGVDSKEDIAMDEFGVLFSYNLFTYFFYQNPEVNEAGESGATSVGCGKSYFEQDLPNYVATFKDFEAVHKCLNEDGDPNGNLWGNKVYYASFDGLEALLVGGAVLWILVMYTITLGVRVVKLAFLRLIAPIPILSYLSPKKDTPFQKWIKQCVTTYLDLFIRLAIIYFCMLLISIIFASDGVAINSATYLSPHDGLYKWFNIILILGILLFAKKIPEILGEIFPSMGGKGGLDLGFGLKSRTDFAGKRVLGGALGYGIGSTLATGQSGWRSVKNKTPLPRAVANAFAANLMGGARGMYHGSKDGKLRSNLSSAVSAQVKESEILNELQRLGITNPVDRYSYMLRKRLGLPGALEELREKIKKEEDAEKAASSRASGFNSILGISNGMKDDSKSKVGSNTTKKQAIETMPEFVKYLQEKGYVGFDEDGKVKMIEKREKMSNGQYKYEFGEEVGHLNVGQLDDKFKRRYKDQQTAYNRLLEAEETLKEKNERYHNLMPELQAVEAELKGMESVSNSDPTKTELLKKKEEYIRLIQGLNFSPVTYDRDLGYYKKSRAEIEQQVELVDIPNIEKIFAEALQTEIVRRNYDDPKAKAAVTAYVDKIKEEMTLFDIQIGSLPDDEKLDNGTTKKNYLKEELKQTHKLIEQLTSQFEKFQLPGNENATIESIFDGNFEEGETPWYTRIVDEFGKVTIKINERIDFAAPTNADGSHQKAEGETIKNIFELQDYMDKIFTEVANVETTKAGEHRAKRESLQNDERYAQLSSMDNIIK